MPVRKVAAQLIPSGLDTKTAPHHVVPGAMVIAENVRYDRKGEARKRLAYGASLSSGAAFASYVNRNIGLDATYLTVRSNSTQALGNSRPDSAYRVLPSGAAWGDRTATTDAYCDAVITPAGAVSTGTYVFTDAAELASGVRFEVALTSTSMYLNGSPNGTSGVTQARCIAVSATEVVLVYLQPSGASSAIRAIKYGYSAAGTLTTVSSTVLAATAVGTATATPYFDAVYLSTTGEVAIAYRSALTAYQIVNLTASTMTVGAKTVTNGEECDKVIAFLEQDESIGRFHLGTCGSTQGVRVQEHLISTFALVGEQVISAATTDARQMTGFRLNASGGMTGVVVEAVSGGYRSVFCGSYFGSGAGTGALGSTGVRNAGLYSRVFLRTSPTTGYVYPHYAVVMDGAVQNTVLLISWGISTGSYQNILVGRALADASGGVLTTVSGLPRVTALSTTRFTFNCLGRRAFDVSGSSFTTSSTMYRFEVDFDQSMYSGPAEIGALHWPGGLVTSAVGESVFPSYPEIVSCTASAGGSLTPSSTYRYIAIFRKTADSGDVLRSAESFSVSVTLGAGNNATTVLLKPPPAVLRVEDLSYAYDIEIYRTPAGGDGSAFYRCGIYSFLSAVLFSSVTTVTFTDTMSDVSLITQEKIYTTGDVLENIAPPASRITHAWKNRLVAAQKRSAWISKEYSAGFGVGFSDTIVVTFDDPGGDITACAVMDDRLYFHRAGGVWALSGDGPTDTGEGGYDRPVLVSTVPGAIKPKLIAETPMGQFYVNNQGVQLLDRGHNVQYIGAPIEGLFTPSTAAKVIYVGDAQEVRVLCSTGTDYVYDMVAQAWTADTHSTTPFVDAVVYNGAMVGLTAAGAVYQESTSSYQDQAATSYAMKLKTGRISSAGIAGLQSLYEVVLTGEVMATSTLLVTVTTYTDTLTKSDTFSFTPAVGRLSAKAKVLASMQRCTSFEIQVEESPASSGQAFRLEALTLWVGVQSGPNPLRASGRFAP